MNLPPPGTYHALPASIALGESKTGLAQYAVLFNITDVHVGNGTYEPTPESWQITGYFYLEQKDGNINTRSIENLKTVFGWDGKDPGWLQDHEEELSQKPVQIVCDNEEYNGELRIKVKWLNPHGSTGSGAGPAKADDATRKRITAKLGSKLRAAAGPSPKPAAAAPAAPAPAARQASARPGPRRAAVTSANTATVDEAYGAMTKACKDAGITEQEKVDAEIYRVADEVIGSKVDDIAALSPEQLHALKTQGPSKVIPF
jgi:hypothetical protein